MSESLPTPSDIDVAISTLEPGTIAGDTLLWDGAVWDNNPLSTYNYPMRITTSNADAFYVRANSSGNKIIDVDTVAATVDIKGDLTVYGNAQFTTVENLQIDNSLIELATGNTADILDIGFYGKYVSAGTHYTGLFRDASDSRWKLATFDVQPNLTVGACVLAALDVAEISANYVYGTISTVSQPSITTLGGLTTINTGLNGILRTTSGVIAGSSTTSHLTEGSNLYYTDVRARGALSGASGISYNSSTGAVTLDSTSSPTFTSLTLSNLTASRLVTTDGSKLLASTNISSWIAGTTNQITSTDNGSGGVTLSTPQSIHTSATPQFSSMGLGTTAGTAGTLNLAGSTSGTITLSAGSTPTSYTLTLPSTAGTNGYALTTNGSGTTTWTSMSAGSTLGFQVYVDQKPSGTVGGTFTSGAWQTRTLNTALTGTLDSLATTSLSSNQFTLTAGTYIVKARAPAYAVGRNQSRLYNVTDTAVAISGTSAYLPGGDFSVVCSEIFYYVVLASSKTYRLEHQCQTTGTNLGFGVPSGTSFAVAFEMYAVVEIYKLA